MERGFAKGENGVTVVPVAGAANAELNNTDAPTAEGTARPFPLRLAEWRAIPVCPMKVFSARKTTPSVSCCWDAATWGRHGQNRPCERKSVAADDFQVLGARRQHRMTARRQKREPAA